MPLEVPITDFATSGIVSKIAQLEVSSLAEENEDRSLPRGRSASTGDLREALPNRGLFISELDLRLAHGKEENRPSPPRKKSVSAETLKRNRSLGFSYNIKSFFRQKSRPDTVSSEKLSADLSTPGVDYERASVEELSLAKENQERYLSTRRSASTGDLREGICGQRNGPDSAPLEISLTDLATSGIVSKGAQLEVSSLIEENEDSTLPRGRSASTGDLREALPNRGLFISELDLRLAHGKEENRPSPPRKKSVSAETLKRNRSFGFSYNIKSLFRQKSRPDTVSSEKLSADLSTPGVDYERASVEELSLAKENQERYLSTRRSASTGDLREGICGQRNGPDSAPLEISLTDLATSGIVSKGAQLEVSSLIEENEDSTLPRGRSASTGDLREALPNRGLFISELDLRLAHGKEENRPSPPRKKSVSAETLKRNRSFGFSYNIKRFFGHKSGPDIVSSEKLSADLSTPGVDCERASVEELSLAKENQEKSLTTRRSASTEDIRDAVTNRRLSISELDLQLAHRQEEASKRSRSFSLSDNVESIFGQSRGSDSVSSERSLTDFSTSEVVSKIAEVEESSLTTENQLEERSFSRRSSGSTRDLRDALPNHGLSISAFDLRLAHREGEGGLASELPRRNRSIGFSDSNKRFIGKCNAVEYVPSENFHTSEILATLSPVFQRLCAHSRRRFSDSGLISKKPEPSPNSSGQKKSRTSLPVICVTPPASDTEQPLFSREHGSTPGTFKACEAKGYPTTESHPLGQGSKIKEEWQPEKRQMLQTDKKDSDFNIANSLHEQSQQKKREQLQQEKEQKSEEKHDDDIEEDGGKHQEVKTQRLVGKLSVKEEQENSEADDSSGEYATIYYAVATYEASGDGEVTALEGDEVKVLAKAPSGWWMVHIDDAVGWVPSNFLVAGESWEEEESQKIVESDLDQENRGPSFDNEYGDDDEDEDEDDDDDDVGMNEIKDVGGFAPDTCKVYPLDEHI